MAHSAERYTIQPIQPIRPQHVSPRDVTLYGEPPGGLIVVGWIVVWLVVGWLFPRFTWLPQLIIATVITGIAVYWSKDRLRKKAADLANRDKQEQFLREQESSVRESDAVTTSARSCYSGAFRMVDAMRQHIEGANACISKAHSKYSSNAASLFWDEIEKAASHLVKFRDQYGSLLDSANKYESMLKGRAHNFPPFPIRPEMVPSPQPTLIAFQETLRLGQTNSHFTLIWETIRTRAVLINGFKTLNDVAQKLRANIEQALQEMEHRLLAMLRNFDS